MKTLGNTVRIFNDDPRPLTYKEVGLRNRIRLRENCPLSLYIPALVKEPGITPVLTNRFFTTTGSRELIKTLKK